MTNTFQKPLQKEKNNTIGNTHFATMTENLQNFIKKHKLVELDLIYLLEPQLAVLNYRRQIQTFRSLTNFQKCEWQFDSWMTAETRVDSFRKPARKWVILILYIRIRYVTAALVSVCAPVKIYKICIII